VHLPYESATHVLCEAVIRPRQQDVMMPSGRLPNAEVAGAERQWCYRLNERPRCTSAQAKLNKQAFAVARKAQAVGTIVKISTRIPRGLYGAYSCRAALIKSSQKSRLSLHPARDEEFGPLRVLCTAL
jgi:hypothetical protein